MFNIDGETLDFMKDIMGLISGSVFINDLEKISTKYAGRNAEKKIIFLNAFYSFLKSLPEGVWANEKSRLAGLQTILVYLEKEALRMKKKQR